MPKSVWPTYTLGEIGLQGSGVKGGSAWKERFDVWVREGITGWRALLRPRVMSRVRPEGCWRSSGSRSPASERPGVSWAASVPGAGRTITRPSGGAIGRGHSRAGLSLLTPRRVL